MDNEKDKEVLKIAEKLVKNMIYLDVTRAIQEFMHCWDVQTPDDVDEGLETLCGTEGNEPDEYWAVDPVLGEELEEKGEIVADFLNWTVWGRTTSGYLKPIVQDSVILSIARDHFKI